MLIENKQGIRLFIAIAIAVLFLFSLQLVSACDDDCSITESTDMGISKRISEISNGCTLYLDDGVYKNFTKISIDEDVTIKGNGTKKSIIFIGSNDVAFHVESGKTLTLYNLTIISNYIYSDDEIADYDSWINRLNGSISGSGSVVFNNCKFINNKQTKVAVTVSANSTSNTNRVTLTANVKDFNNNDISGDVVFYINNVLYAREYASNGIATHSLNLPNGNYKVHAAYIGNGYDNSKISQNQLDFTVNFVSIQALSVALPPTGNTTWYVDPTAGSDTNDGKTPTSAKRSFTNASGAFSLARDGDSIILQPGTYAGAGLTAITVNKNITFIGNNTEGHVIIAPPNNNAFMTISAGTSTAPRTVNLANMIIRGLAPGSTTTARMITLNAFNTINLDYVQFTDIRSSATGPAIYSNANQVRININNSVFYNVNSTGTGGAIKFEGTNNNVFLLINSSNFTNINGTYGGVIHGYPTNVSMDIYNSNFENCLATQHGGVACGDGRYVRFYNSNFTDCRSTGTTTTGASPSGGGVTYIHQSNTREASMAINCIFRDSSSATFGGAVFADGGASMIINDSKFYDSSARMQGGAIYANGGNVTVDKSYFQHNYVFGTATVYGGALAATSGTIAIYNSEFFNNSARNNSATGVAYGGVAGVNGANAVITLVNCKVHDNWARYGGAFGTGSSGGRIEVINNTAIYNNRALTYGGVAGLGASGTIIIQNSIIYNNTAGTYGGAFGATGGTINVTNSQINNNSAEEYGGALGVSGAGTINIFDSLMFDNRAIFYGGAVGAAGGTINVRNSTLARNRANGTTSTTGYGGAIGLTTGNIYVYDSKFFNNTAQNYGGAVGVPQSGVFYANNSLFQDNIAGTYGGAIGSGAGVNISYCNFTNNVAGTNGGAVSALHPTANNFIYSCQFEFNTANGTALNNGGMGNAIYAANRLTANYNRFFNNSGNDGGFLNTLWTNNSTANNPSTNVNINFNWWGDNQHYASGNLPQNWVVVNLNTLTPELYNGSAHYVYSIGVQGNNTAGFTPTNLPPFFGDVIFEPPFDANNLENFDAHYTHTIRVPFSADAIHKGYAIVDNWKHSFTVHTNTTPTVSLGNTTGKYKDNVILNATFRDNRGYVISSGLNVSFYVAGVWVGNNVTDANGFVTVPYIVASAGNLNYTVRYNGSNANYNAINGSIILTFHKLNTSITVNNPSINTQSGSPVTLNVTIRDEHGDTVRDLPIDFYLSTGLWLGRGISDISGNAVINWTFTTQGNYNWYAVFNGTGNYTASNSSAQGNTGSAIITPIVELVISKTSSVSTAKFGDTVIYTITVTNNGPDIATNIVVTDKLDDRLILQFVNGTNWNYNNTTRTITWNIASLASASSVTLNITVIINGTGNISNIANVEVKEPNNGSNNSTVNITVDPAVNLTIIKYSNATNGIAAYNDVILYTINVTNTGFNRATNVVVTDILDNRLLFMGYKSSQGSYNNTTGLWHIGDIEIGHTVSLNITVRIIGTGLIVNIANITELDQDNIGDNDSSETPVTVNETVYLTITKTSNVTDGVNSSVGDWVLYTITVHNHGPDNATNVVVNDVLDPRLAFVNATGSPSIVSNNLTWIIANLAMGSHVTFNVTVCIIGTGNIPNMVTVTVNENNIGDNNATDDVNVPATVNLVLNKTSNATGGVASFGDFIRYNIIVSNDGPDVATGVVITDKLDPRLILETFTPIQGTYDPGTGLWDIGNITVGQTVTLVIDVRINGTGPILNIATVTSLDQSDNQGDDSSDTSVDVPSTVNLNITKVSNATNGVAAYLDYITYTITVSNYGPDNATNVVVSDRLDDRLRLISVTPIQGTYNSTTGLWEIGTIVVGTPVTLTFYVQIIATGYIPNIATVINFDEDENWGNDKSNADVNVLSTVNLTITKTSNVTTGTNSSVGDLVLYTITVHNHGPDNATNVVVNDVLDPRLELVSATGSPSIMANNLTWNIANIANGTNVTFNITVKIIGTGNISNVANVNSKEINIGENDSETSVSVPSSVNITISKTINGGSTSAQYLDYVTYTIVVSNLGPDNATGVNVTDRLDSRLAYVNYTSTKGAYNPVNGEWFIGNMNDKTYETLTITARIIATGDIPNIATVTVQQDNIGEDRSQAPNINVPTTVNLTINKISNATGGKAAYLDIIHYNITVANYGPDTASNIVVNDFVDSRLVIRNITGGSHIQNGNEITWTIGSLAAGSSVTLTITVQINGTGDIPNVANIISFEEKKNIGNDDSSDTDVKVLETVNLTITKTSNVTNGNNASVGDSVLYTITVHNNGPDNATNVVVTDIIDGRLTIESIAGNRTYNNQGNNITWTIGNLTKGTNVTLSITVCIIGTGNIPNVANVRVTEVNIGDDSAKAPDVVVPSSVNLTISKTSNATSAVIGDLVVYNITVHNHGPDNATNVVVTDLLDNRLQFISATGGNYIPGLRTLNWNIGNLAKGTNVTLLVTVMIIGEGNIENVANVTTGQTNIGEDSSTAYVDGELITTFISIANLTANATAPFVITGNVTSNNPNWIVNNGYVIITIEGTNGTHRVNGTYNVTVNNGRFSLAQTHLIYGKFSLTAEYFGITTFKGSNTDGWLNIIGLPTSITVNNATLFRLGRNTSFVAVLFDNYNNRPLANANVTFEINGVNQTPVTTDALGRAIEIIHPIGNTNQTFEIRVYYNGNDTYFSSMNEITRIASPTLTFIIVENKTDHMPLENDIIVVVFIDEFGDPLDGVELEINIGGKPANVRSSTTDRNGRIIIDYRADITGTLDIEVKVVDPTHSHFADRALPEDGIGFVHTTLRPTEVTISHSFYTTLMDVVFRFTVYDERWGTVLSNKTGIRVMINDELLDEVFTTDRYGNVYINLGRFGEGQYVITILFPGNNAIVPSTWAPSNITSIVYVRLVRTTVFVSAIHNGTDSTNFVARLFDEYGNLLVNKPIAFFLNGMFIGFATTDHRGIAILPYAFTPGGEIAAEYLGDHIYRQYMDNRTFTGNLPVPIEPEDIPVEPEDIPAKPNDVSVDPDPVDPDDPEPESEDPVPGIAMLKTGNPFAMILLCLLSILFIGLKTRKKN